MTPAPDGSTAAAPRPAGARECTAYVLSVWFGCGHVPVAPGTAGTLGAIPLYLLVRPLGLAAVAADGRSS